MHLVVNSMHPSMDHRGLHAHVVGPRQQPQGDVCGGEKEVYFRWYPSTRAFALWHADIAVSK